VGMMYVFPLATVQPKIMIQRRRPVMALWWAGLAVEPHNERRHRIGRSATTTTAVVVSFNLLPLSIMYHHHHPPCWY
jgi:hypothetical protein